MDDSDRYPPRVAMRVGVAWRSKERKKKNRFCFGNLVREKSRVDE